jgi:hypothetical protein
MAFLAGSGGAVAGTLIGGLVGALIGRRHGRLSSPTGLTFDANGDLFIANSGNGAISEVTPGGKVSTFASGLSNPQDLIFDSNGNLFVANMPCGKPRKRTSPSAAPWRKW